MVGGGYWNSAKLFWFCIIPGCKVMATVSCCCCFTGMARCLFYKWVRISSATSAYPHSSQTATQYRCRNTKGLIASMTITFISGAVGRLNSVRQVMMGCAGFAVKGRVEALRRFWCGGLHDLIGSGGWKWVLENINPNLPPVIQG